MVWERQRFGNEALRRLQNFVMRPRQPEPLGHSLLGQTEALPKLAEVPGHPSPCLPRRRRGILPLLSQVRPSLCPGCNRGFFVAECTSILTGLSNRPIRKGMTPRLYTTREVA